VPERAVDASSLVAHADVVVSAGGTMNREAVALGTPVWTVFAERLGAVDERLVAEGRLRLLRSAAELRLEQKPPAALPRTRDPALLLDLMLTALE
jgi:predicted glycosyltransferase